MENQKKVKQTWSIKLGLVQAVVLLGVITGSMLCSFYLGLVSGQKAGFESAQAINLASVAKLPIPDQYREEELDAAASKVFAKLSEPERVIDENHQAPELPTLAAIEMTKVVRPELPLDDLEEAIIPKSKNQNVITILTDPPAIKSNNKLVENIADQETIGSLKDATLTKQVDNLEEQEDVQDYQGSSVLETLKDSDLIEIKKSDLVVKEAQKKRDDLVEDIADSDNNITVLKSKKELITKKADTLLSNKDSQKIKNDLKAKEAEKTKDKKPTSFVKSKISTGWYAQVAAPSKLDDANGLAKKLKDSGFSSSIEVANIRGQEYYRVLVGPEEERKYSESMVQQLKREKYLRGDPFIRLIK